jgi:hypothetical protein
MFLSKIWVFLLAIAAALAFGVALVVPRPAAREIAKSYAENLDRGQHNADLMLRLEARDWIDAVAKMAWDTTLVDVLEQASNRKGDFKQHQAKAGGRLLSLVGRLKSEFRPQLQIAVDYRGKQIARLGPGEDKLVPGETGLAGYPLVEAALRGYRSDDTWNVDGKLFLLAASPVISRSKGRYVGAIILGHELNDVFARRLKARLGGTDVAFFLRGKIVASTSEARALDKLPMLFTKRRAQIVRDGRTAALRVGDGPGAHNVILASLPGEAAEHDAFYAAIGSAAPNIGLGEMLSLVRKSDLTWREFPWLLLGGALLAALVVGFVLPLWESDMPGRRLLNSLHKVARREAAKLDDRLYPGRFGSIARAVNEALDKAQQAQKRSAQQQPQAASPALLERDVRFGDRSAAAAVESLGPMIDERLLQGRPAARPSRTSPEEAATEVQPPPVFSTEPQFESLEAISAEMIPASAPASVPVSVTPSAKKSEPPPMATAGAAAAFDLEPLLIPKAGEAAPSGTPPLRKVRIPSSEERSLPRMPLGDNPQVVLPPVPPPVPPQPPKLPAEPKPAEPKPIVSTPPEPKLAPPAMPPAAPGEPKPAEPVPPDPDEEYFHQVYKDFLAIKRQCGENISSLTYERFAEKLRKNRETLVKNYSCKSVKFQVYIKDGKAALKATPVKEE